MLIKVWWGCANDGWVVIKVWWVCANGGQDRGVL